MSIDNKIMNTITVSKKEIAEINTHLIVAFLCLPVYQFGGVLFKYVLAPYVLYLLFSTQHKFIPALLVHFING
jgi:hypothetical protein